MKSITYKLLLISFVFMLLSCTNSEDQKIKHKPYSILIDNFTSDFQSSITKFNTLELDTIYIPLNKVNSVVLGYFDQYQEAKSFAENLILDSVITEYSLFKNDSLKSKFNSKFRFVSLFKDIPSIYTYDFHTEKFDLIWGEWGRNVFGLYPHEENNITYFLTSLSWGRRGGIPYILNARLYYLDNYKDTIKRKRIIGKGNLINGFWLEDNFNLYFYYLDSVKTSIMKRFHFEYEVKGNLINRDSSEFDLLSGGFPLPPKKNLNFFSPSNKYRIITGIKDTLNTISLYNEIKGDSSAIYYTSEELLQIEWSYDDTFSFIKTAELYQEKNKNKLKSTIIIYNNDEQRIVNQINGEGIKNFFIFGNTIVFDDGIETNSKIYFYDFRKNSFIRIVEHKYGLGIYTYPQIPE